jgi:DNA-binding response OmpR family regulator
MITQEKAEQKLSKNGLNLLIVEDDPTLLSAYSMAFADTGIEADTARGGKEALEKAQQKQYDFILLDILMPGMDGLEFLRRFKPVRQEGTRVIVFSNLSASESIKEAMELGADDYLLKAHFTPSEMIALIKGELLESSEENDG